MTPHFPIYAVFIVLSGPSACICRAGFIMTTENMHGLNYPVGLLVDEFIVGYEDNAWHSPTEWKCSDKDRDQQIAAAYAQLSLWLRNQHIPGEVVNEGVVALNFNLSTGHVTKLDPLILKAT